MVMSDAVPPMDPLRALMRGRSKADTSSSPKCQELATSRHDDDFGLAHGGAADLVAADLQRNGGFGVAGQGHDEEEIQGGHEVDGECGGDGVGSWYPEADMNVEEQQVEEQQMEEERGRGIGCVADSESGTISGQQAMDPLRMLLADRCREPGQAPVAHRLSGPSRSPLAADLSSQTTPSASSSSPSQSLRPKVEDPLPSLRCKADALSDDPLGMGSWEAISPTGTPTRSGGVRTADPSAADYAADLWSWASAGFSSSGGATESGGHWRCELCFVPTVPLLGSLAGSLKIGRGKRHHCRNCGRTVCGCCSSVSEDEMRTCLRCRSYRPVSGFPKENSRLQAEERREKYVFLVRHAESTWNVAMAAGAAGLASQAMDRDHPLSEDGLRQITTMRERIEQGLPVWGGHKWNAPDAKSERVRRFYNAFLVRRGTVNSSPLLRAVQTAHILFAPIEGWGGIRLLRNAREHFRFVTERDCLGCGCGKELVERAARIGAGCSGLSVRVDCNDCFDQWWSESPEQGEDLEARHMALWKTLLQEDPSEASILVTHSNLIRALMNRFAILEGSAVDPHCDVATMRNAQCEKLENAGIIGIKCVLRGFAPKSGRNGTSEPIWSILDALLMFGSTWRKA